MFATRSNPKASSSPRLGPLYQEQLNSKEPELGLPSRLHRQARLRREIPLRLIETQEDFRPHDQGAGDVGDVIGPATEAERKSGAQAAAFRPVNLRRNLADEEYPGGEIRRDLREGLLQFWCVSLPRNWASRRAFSVSNRNAPGIHKGTPLAAIQARAGGVFTSPP